MRSGVIGAGFMGQVHARAIRAAGGELVAAVAAHPERALALARSLGTDRPAHSVEELIAFDDVDVVHVCTPNDTHLELALAALEAGKHVICEKPLAVDVTGATRLLEAAQASGRVAAIPFVYRFYPLVREVRARVRRGDAGILRLLHGSYLQDWLVGRESSNWRVDAALGGPSRAFADIGVHWVDLVEFTSGHRIVELSATTLTAHPHRGLDGDRAAVHTEDVAAVTFRTDGGALGSLAVSQISLGHQNRLVFSLEGDEQTLAFDQELPERLSVATRRSMSTIARGGPGLLAEARRYDRLPAGHPQGYQDCFNAFVADVYAAVAGRAPTGLPTFADGVRAARVTAAVLESARSGRWQAVAA